MKIVRYHPRAAVGGHVRAQFGGAFDERDGVRVVPALSDGRRRREAQQRGETRGRERRD